MQRSTPSTEAGENPAQANNLSPDGADPGARSAQDEEAHGKQPSLTSPSKNSPEFRKVRESAHNFADVAMSKFPTVDLVNEFPFSHPDKQVHERTWQDEWRSIVIEQSPYNDLVGPIREPNIPTAAEVADRRMKKVKAKLGIPDEGLFDGIDPAATRTKSGKAPASADEGYQRKMKRKKEREAEKKEKRRRELLLRKQMASGQQPLLEGGGVSFNINVASHAGKITVDLTNESRAKALMGGRRGGFSIGSQSSQKKVKRVLKLVPADMDTVKMMEGDVPIDQWRNELSHIQMALGMDDDHKMSDFPLSKMKLENPAIAGGEPPEKSRRPENVAMDSYELPKYLHDNKADPSSRKNEDEFVEKPEKPKKNLGYKDASDGYQSDITGQSIIEEAKDVGIVSQEYYAKKAVFRLKEHLRKEQHTDQDQQAGAAVVTPKKVALGQDAQKSAGALEPIPYVPLDASALEGVGMVGPPVIDPSLSASNQKKARTSRPSASKPTRTSIQNAKSQKLIDFLSKVESASSYDDEISGAAARSSAMDNFSVDPPPIERSVEMRNLLTKKLEDNLGSGFWNDEIGSSLAKDLTSEDVYNPRAKLLLDPTTALSLQSQLPDPIDDVEEKLPSSKSSSSTRVPSAASRRGTAGTISSSRGESRASTTRSEILAPMPDSSMAKTDTSRPRSTTAHFSKEATSRPTTGDSATAAAATKRPATAPIPNTLLKKPKVSASLTETIVIADDAKSAAWLREQAKEKLALGQKAEAERLFGEAAALLVDHEADVRVPTEVFPYAPHVHVAANLIQKMCRKRFEIELKAQIMFAALFRGHSSRKYDRMVKNRRKVCAKCIQQGWWKYLEHKLEARIALQCMFRQTKARIVTKSRRLERKASMIIQCFARKFIARGVYLYYLLRYRSSTKIQQCWRGYATRLGRYVALLSLYNYHCMMASRITARVRGWRGRRFGIEQRKKVIHAEHTRYTKEKNCVDAAVKLAMSRSGFFLESDDGAAFTKLEMEKLLQRKLLMKDHLKSLSEEERQRHNLTEVFETFDLDSSGSIDSNELEVLLNELGMNVSEDFLAEAIKEMDEDDSGEIAFDEFYAWFLDRSKESSRRRSLFPAMRLSAISNAATRRQAKINVQLHFTRLAGRQAQSHYRVENPPRFFCTVCRAPFGLFKDYLHHFEKKGDGYFCGNVTSKQEEASEDSREVITTTEVKGRDFKSGRHMLFPDFIVGRLQHQLQKRAELEHCRHMDEKMEIDANIFLTKIKTDSSFKLQQGRRDLMRLKAHLLNMKKNRREKMKAEGSKPEEIRAFDVKEAFEAFDVDGGGSIDAGEFGEVLRSMGIHLSQEEVMVSLHRIDKDGSGRIEFDEFEAWNNKRELEFKRRNSAFSIHVKALRSKLAENSLVTAAAEKTARRYLQERSRLRCEIETVRTIRKTRQPNFGWCSSEWLEKHAMQHLSMTSSLEESEELRRALRVVEEKCEVPHDTKPWGLAGFKNKKEVDEGAGAIRAQNLAEQECRRWLKSGGGRRAIVKQSYILNSLAIDSSTDKKKRRAREAFNVHDTLFNGDIDVEDAYRVVHRRGIWLDKAKREKLANDLRTIDANGFNFDALDDWMKGITPTRREKFIGALINIPSKVYKLRYGKWKEQSKAFFISRARAEARSRYYSERYMPGGVSSSRHATPDNLVLKKRGLSEDKQEEVASADDGAAYEVDNEQKLVDTRPEVGGDDHEDQRARANLIKINRAKARREKFECGTKLIEREMLVKDSEEEAESSLRKFVRKKVGAEVLNVEIGIIKAARDSLKSVQLGLSSRDKKIESCRYMFRVFDVDQSGGIDVEELGDLCRRLCIPLSEAENLSLINKMDQDSSGSVDFDEFAAWYLDVGLKRKLRLAGGWKLMLLSWLNGHNGKIRRDAFQSLRNRVKFAARSAVLASLTDEENRLVTVPTTAAGNADLAALQSETISSRPNTREDRGGSAMGITTDLASVDFSTATVIEEASDDPFPDPYSSESESIGDDRESEASKRESETDDSDESDVSDDDSNFDDDEEGSSHLIEDGEPYDVSGKNSYISEAEVKGRIDALMWKAENNATASVKEFLNTEAGMRTLQLEMDRLAEIRRVIAVGSVKAKDKLTRYRLRLRQLFGLHEMGEELDLELVHCSNNDYVEIDSGEVKYFLRRAGVRGVRGGALNFPAVLERGGMSKVNLVTFEDVWEWLLEADASWRRSKREGAEGGSGEKTGIELMPEMDLLPKNPPLPSSKRAKRTSIRDDAAESIMARARSAARRNVLFMERMLTNELIWGGKGARESSQAALERLARRVEVACALETKVCERSRMRGKAGRARVAESYAKAKHRRQNILKGRGFAQDKFALLASSDGNEGGLKHEEGQCLLAMQRAEIPTLLKLLNARPGASEKKRRKIFEELVRTRDMGHVLRGSYPDMVSLQEFEEAWERSWQGKGLYWKMGVRRAKMNYLFCRMSRKTREGKIAFLSACRSEKRQSLSQKAREAEEKEKEAMELWGGDAEEKHGGGGASWVDIEELLRRQFL